jgi:phage tail sheath gpL-like
MSDTINLPYYQVSNRTYGVFADVDGSKANTAIVNARALLVGQMLAGGTGVVNAPILVESLQQVGLLTGVGSMLYEMVKQYRVTDTAGELWILILADPTGQAATGSLVLSSPGPYTSSGLIALYIGGVVVSIPVNVGDTGSALLARTIAAINAVPDVAAVASASTAAAATTITLTAKHVGLLGNDIDLRFNYQGALGGETFAAPFTITAMTGGAGAPSASVWSAAQAALTDALYDFVGMPYDDAASLSSWDTFFNFQSGRWSWNQMLYGGYFTAQRGAPGALQTFGLSRNGPNGSCLGFYDCPDPCWVVAAEYTAQCASSLRNDPNVPLQNLTMNLHAPPATSAIIRTLRNTLLYSGISTYTIVQGQMVLERACTFYQENAAGAADNSYLDVETMYGTALLIRDWRQEMLRLFPRSKLFIDGTPIPAGAMATSAAQIRIATIAWYRTECANLNGQDPDGFAAACLAQNTGNGLVKALLPFILPNQLRAIAGLVAFTKP